MVIFAHLKKIGNYLSKMNKMNKRWVDRSPVYIPPGGVLRFELDRGVPLEPQNPYPSLRVILAEKGTHF